MQAHVLCTVKSTCMWRTSHEDVAHRHIGSCEGQARSTRSGFGPDTSRKVWIRAMTSKVLKRLVPAMLLSAALFAPGPADATEQDRVQFCWAMGKFDHTIYFAEVGESRGPPGQLRHPARDFRHRPSRRELQHVGCIDASSGARDAVQELARVRVRNRQHDIHVGSRLLKRGNLSRSFIARPSHPRSNATRP